MRQLKRAREETCGEELSQPQQVQYAIQECERMVDEAREVRQTTEAMKAGNGDAKVAAESSTNRPSAPREPEKRSSSSKATADGAVDKYWLQWEKREGETSPKSAAPHVQDPDPSPTAEQNRGAEEGLTADEGR